jgi:hypothetical protein
MGSDKRCPAQGSTAGSVWFIGWLFTISFAQLGFWKAVLALLLWPWFLGEAVRAIPPAG